MTTYYVSTSGSNSNSGTSTGSPWQTVAKVNSTTLNAGDTVLFNGGNTFAGTALAPTTSGTSGSPITYGSYGTGNATITNTGSGNAVYLYNVGGYVVENLTLTGPGGATAGAGVWFESGSGAQHAPVTISGVTASNWYASALGIADGTGDGFSAIT